MKHFSLILVLLLVTVIPALAADIYVSPKGNDAWSGKVPDPDAAGKDGPFATIEAALKVAKEARKAQPVRIHLRGGTYFLERPLLITPDAIAVKFEDPRGRSRRGGQGITIAAYKDEKPVLSGGRRITGFNEQKLNARTVWVADLPDVKSGKWDFRQLWVNGERRYRARLPKKGLYKVQQAPNGPWPRGQDRFNYAKGQLRTYEDLDEIEVSVLSFWTNDYMPIKSIDEAKREVVLEYPNSFGHLKIASYWVENILEELTEPGEWCLRRKTGKLYYLPRPGERIDTAEVIAPALERIVRIEGAENDKVAGLRFEGLTFSHNRTGTPPRKAAPSLQAAWPIPGAVSLANVSGITFDRCRIERVGSYAFECDTGARDVTLSRSVLRDLGTGGVKIWHGSDRTTIADNEIGPGTRFFHNGCGILIGRSDGNRIIHNNIHDFDYSGISVGWNWGPGDNCFGNVIEWNHIYNIGNGMQSDLAGVYFLGVQNGTRVRFNRIHDVACLVYGAWGLYGDGWASGILIESNLVYNTQTGSFHTNVGLNLELYNNIFGPGRLHQLTTDYAGAAHSIWLERNIILSNGTDFLHGPWDKIPFHTGSNLVWDLKAGAKGKPGENIFKLFGPGSIYADPLFKDPLKGDFRLKDGSPAAKIGFVPFDLTKVGPRAADEK
jgi:hypothetical protein